MIEFNNEADAYDISKNIYFEMMQMGFAKKDCNMVAASVSEITTNALRYAGSGKAIIKKTANLRGIEVTIEDEGPGIENLSQAMKDGYTTMDRFSLGVGLGAAKRAMDYFQINRRKKGGTEIIMRKYFSRPNLNIEYGVVSIPDNLREINGDEVFVREFEGDKVLMSVIDGLGEGKNARRSANLAKEILEKNFAQPLTTIIKMCGTAIKEKGERGVTIGLLLIKPNSIEYAGVGDTFIQVFPKFKTTFFSQPGIVGTKATPTIKIQRTTYNGSERAIVMCTDGIHDHFAIDNIPPSNSAQDIADSIMSSYRRRYGDATVLVAKIRPLEN